MVVIDASVVLKWFFEEEPELTFQARALLEKFLQGQEQVVAPSILLYEIGNIFGSKAGFSLRDAQKNWKRFAALKIPIFDTDADFIGKCVNSSKKYHVSVYDASYAVLAKMKKCDFITADEKFVEQVNLPYVKKLEYSTA